MHVEVNVALNFVISYLYNKLPRRRVDLFGAELEAGLKKKFEGHWYPEQPVKGSGFRCVKVNGEKVDPVVTQAATAVGLDLDEMQDYLPKELTVWIDPNEVSYRIGEKGQVKILYSDRNNEENNENEDREVQATNRGFNPEAQAFNPDADSFEPIDRLSASLGTLNLSPHSGGMSPSDVSPVSSASWGGSNSTSPSGGPPFPSLNGTTSPPVVYAPKRQNTPMFTTATFAQTKFGSTKLKSTAKRPTRLSPTEFGNFFRQRAVPNNLQYSGLATPPRSRSLSPRDPRIEFLLDQQQRFLHNQHQQQLQQQFQQQQQMLQQQQQLSLQLQQQQQYHSQNRLGVPTEHPYISSPSHQVSGSLHDMFSGPSPLQSPVQAQLSPQSQQSGPYSQWLNTSSPHSPSQSSASPPARSPVNPLQISPDNQKVLFDGLSFSNGPYSSTSQYHQLLLAS